jgi:cell division protein FtsQ
MWDNPRLLNLTANALVALVVAVALWAALVLLARSPLFPLRELSVSGPLEHTTRADIERALGGYGANFFAADLGAMRAKLEALPWVRTVELRRVWPDRLEARLEEHVALARWGDAGLVNTHGEPFGARLAAEAAARLPLFTGPARTEHELARRYRRFAEVLQPLDEAPERVVLTARHAWQLRTSGGMQLELGRDGSEPVEARLARFVAAHPATLGRLQKRADHAIRHVDLRYPNGFVLRVPEWRG